MGASHLRSNTKYAYQSWRESVWHETVDEELFFNHVLPYASVTESRDDWRRDFYERFKGHVASAKNPGEAAAILNNQIFEDLGVKYSTKRRATDQGPLETIESGMATCTGLSILLIDACRAVGIPARLVGTPMWKDGSGNHSWVEVWDGDRWRFTGAAEPSGMELDAGWFVDRASTAERDSPIHAIYATSFAKTDLPFPCSWAPGSAYSVSAVNVTNRYAKLEARLPDGMVRVRLQVLDTEGGSRVARQVQVTSDDGKVWLADMSRDETADTNDHAWGVLAVGEEYQVRVETAEGPRATSIGPVKREKLYTITLDSLEDSHTSNAPVAQLARYLVLPNETRGALVDQPFATEALSEPEFAAARELLWQDRVARTRERESVRIDDRLIKVGEHRLRFDYEVFGEPGENGRSLYIGMHGGGNAPEELNTRQWKGHLSLYRPTEGIYLCPRAPRNTWDMWHGAEVDDLFQRLIEAMVAVKGVDPNRVYLFGYSAGGDGVYQLAPRMADAFAAAAMMAGHPNEASPLGLRNLPFAIYMGADDSAYDRNLEAARWRRELAALQDGDPGGYHHLVEIFPGKGHWMDRLDAAAVDWMSRYTREPVPKRVVWRQDDVRHKSFYWLAVNDADVPAGAEIVASANGQTIDITARGVDQITIRVDDRLVSMDVPVQIKHRGVTLFEAVVPRSIATAYSCLEERGDPEMMFAGEVTIEFGAAE